MGRLLWVALALLPSIVLLHAGTWTSSQSVEGVSSHAPSRIQHFFFASGEDHAAYMLDDNGASLPPPQVASKPDMS